MAENPLSSPSDPNAYALLPELQRFELTIVESWNWAVAETTGYSTAPLRSLRLYDHDRSEVRAILSTPPARGLEELVMGVTDETEDVGWVAVLDSLPKTLRRLHFCDLDLVGSPGELASALIGVLPCLSYLRCLSLELLPCRYEVLGIATHQSLTRLCQARGIDYSYTTTCRDACCSQVRCLVYDILALSPSHHRAELDEHYGTRQRGGIAGEHMRSVVQCLHDRSLPSHADLRPGPCDDSTSLVRARSGPLYRHFGSKMPI